MLLNLSLNSKFFIRRDKNKFIENYLDYLVFVYQPIVGSVAINLYITLKSIGDNRKSFAYNTYLDLLKYTRLNQEDLFMNLRKLEAIKLITCFQMLHDSYGTIFIYEIHSPLDLPTFLSDKILYKLLLYYVDNEYIETLSKRFMSCDENIDKILNLNKTIRKNVVFLRDVFKEELTDTTVVVDDRRIDTRHNKYFEELKTSLAKKSNRYVELAYKYKDYILLQVKLHDLSIEEVTKLITSISINENITDYKKILKKNFYRFTNKKNNDFECDMNLDSINIRKIKGLSSVKYLNMLLGILTPMDLKNINILKKQYKLNDETINTLYNYCLYKYKSINFNLVEKIANTWFRKNINNFEQAISFLKDKKRYRVSKSTKNLKKYKSKDITSSLSFNSEYEEQIIEEIEKIN